ncbi:MAG: UDP-N-acetylmuramate dehydrogenase [Caldilineaceae bacterium]|nr:UDP-N-acetylmuramate dehydrogenase [Caldilineaceae bacterium]
MPPAIPENAKGTTNLLDLALPAQLGLTIQSGVMLAPYTSMKVGGPAQYFATVKSTEQMVQLVQWARRVELPYFLLGGGSNMLISDAGIRGLVIHNRCRQVRVEAPPRCDQPHDPRPYLMAESGALMAGVARQSVREGLTGLEWAVSVPGTVGGAVVGNAGAHGGEVKDTLACAMLIDAAGDVVEVPQPDFAYAYRASRLKQPTALRAGFNPVVLSAYFRLNRGEEAEIRSRADQFLQHRRRTQPVEPSLGSTFVNPPGDHAGRLIEAAGLKGARVGGVEVSSLHANFIVNPGGVGAATAQDVVRLMAQIQTTVEGRFGIVLTPEVQLIGEWSSD